MDRGMDGQTDRHVIHLQNLIQVQMPKAAVSDPLWARQQQYDAGHLWCLVSTSEVQEAEPDGPLALIQL